MRRGWFKIPGVQDGDRTLAQQILGLEDLDVRGHDVLELGCAEGLMTRWLVKHKGALHVTGVDVIDDHVNEAMRQNTGVPSSFLVHDLNEPRPWGGYDTVIALAVLHKLRRPDVMAATIASIARKQIILRLPPEHAPVVIDQRSGMRPFDCEAPILQRGFKERWTSRGSFGEWTRCYQRISP